MNFNKHNSLEGLHAPFSPSKSSWLRYDDEKLIEVYKNLKAAEMGTRLHQWAKDTIDLGLKQPRSKKTIYAYVNDAIGFKMETEVVLFYSERFFGTADAISFRNGVLRIHDLKTGKRPVHMELELRIYQSDEILYHNPTAEDILPIMDKIVYLDKLLQKLESEEG